MSLFLGTVDQFTDALSTIDPQVLVAAQAVNLGVNKARLFQAMVPIQFGISGDVFDVNGRTITKRTATLAADINDTVTALTVQADDIVAVGDVIVLGTERMVVQSVSGTTVNVFARGAAGTTAAAHTAGDSISIVSKSIGDVDLKNQKAISETTETFENYAQLFSEVLDMTKMAKMMKSGGGKINPDDIEQVLIQEALVRLGGVLGWTAINGLKDSNHPRLTAGILQQLDGTNLQTTPINAQGSALTEALLKSAIEQSASYGAPDVIIVSPKNKGIVNNFDLASGNVDVTKDVSSTQGGNFVETYVYEGITLNIMVDQDMPDSDVVVAPLANLQKAWVRDDTLKVVDEPVLSSREIRKSLAGSLGFAVKNPIESCRLYNIG